LFCFGKFYFSQLSILLVPIRTPLHGNNLDGNDKVQQCYDTAAAGFKFYVLPPSVGTLVHWEHDAPDAFAPKPLATTQTPMGLLGSAIRRAECAWPGSRDRFVCDSNLVRRSTLWYRLTTPAFYRIVGCSNTEQRLPRMSSSSTFARVLDSKEREASTF
jgi:hypothetical protein